MMSHLIFGDVIVVPPMGYFSSHAATRTRALSAGGAKPILPVGALG